MGKASKHVKKTYPGQGCACGSKKTKPAAPPKSQEDIVQWLLYFEGTCDYFYIDSAGKVTIGTGLEFDNVNQVLNGKATDNKAKLAFEFVTDNKEKLTLIDAIKKDFEQVSKYKRKACYYMNERLVKATPETVTMLFNNRLEKAKQYAKTYFESVPLVAKLPEKWVHTKFDLLPAEVRCALIDMAFNLGLGGLMKFKKLRVDLYEGRWDDAATESHRIFDKKNPDKVFERNTEINKWIKSAGKPNDEPKPAPIPFPQSTTVRSRK